MPLARLLLLLPLLCARTAAGADDSVESRLDANALRQLADIVVARLGHERKGAVSQAVLASGEVRVPSGERFDQLAGDLDATKAELLATKAAVVAQQSQIIELRATVEQLMHAQARSMERPGEAAETATAASRRLQGADATSPHAPPATPQLPSVPPPPPAVFSHLQEETYTGTVDCGRGTVQSDATAAGLPMNTEPYTVLLEFKCTAAGTVALYAWGSASANSMNGMVVYSTQLHHYWYDNGLDWYFSDSGMSISDICDGAWHTTGTQFDGTTRRIFFDGATVASDTPSGSHATINTNFCLGAPATVDTDAFSGM